MTILASSLFLLLALLTVQTVAQPPADPLRNFCRRYGHQTAVIDRKLYIDGGWLYANPISQNPIPTMNEGLLYCDLDYSYQDMPPEYANLTKNSSIPDVAGGTLWQDEVNKVFWLYGGEFQAAPSTFQLWGYDVILNQWNLSSPTLGSTSPIQRVSYGAGVASSEIGMGFYYGGYLNNLTNPLWTGPQWATSNLIVYDMDQNTLTNYSGYDNIGRAEGIMVYIPASIRGLLVYFGGVTFPYGNETEVAVCEAKWYTQTATGTIPEMRRKFCGGVTWADDQTSYNIYLYGGFGFGENATGFDDVYILTMPTFEWIKWYPDNPGPGSPHGLLTCNVIDRGQMIVMGGNFTNTTACDVPASQGQHNLNLGQYDSTDAKWYAYLPNLTEYFVPPAILQVAGGTPEGGAIQKAPTNGWDDDRLSVYFGEKAVFTSRTPTRALPTATATSPSPKPSPPSPSKKTNIGAIVGGAVAGTVALLLAIGIACLCVRRHKKAKNNQPNPAAGATPVPGAAQPFPPTSPRAQYVINEKHSTTVASPGSTSRVGSPSDQQHSSQYSTPPPPPSQHPEYPSYYYAAAPAPGGPGSQPTTHYYPVVVASGQQHQQPYAYPAVQGAVPMPMPMPFYPPPPEPSRMESHEMPTVRSPEIIQVHQPRPLRPPEGLGE
ncbi:uncharacterized protein Z519_09623 [Cladophialophora bantiana CBS 173.52]|uniref:Kelch repeat-containing protein n=1 Tax=Cladophialophora bantiana (strain ATCC 10958 / CBS 173.52 / CDC B-1940 / NIH 8579) TaxID=1442370 RepID=A0A0D2FSD2_CLAB1|nr:uncharacterized protein Z519_09623 [Cladophialophora bantiana CBS 173.52]KIW89467.1 hypothetical protein Z519_09623 [Cladophialophora bantiana CBS 173.52]